MAYLDPRTLNKLPECAATLSRHKHSNSHSNRRQHSSHGHEQRLLLIYVERNNASYKDDTRQREFDCVQKT